MIRPLSEQPGVQQGLFPPKRTGGRLACSSSDRVLFGAAKAVKFPVETVAGGTVSEPFSTRVQQAVQAAFKDVDPDILHAMKENGFKVVLAEYPTQGFKALEDIIPKKDIPFLLRLHRNTLTKILEAGSIQSVQMKEALKDDQAVGQEVFKLLKDNLDRQTGVVFIEGQKAIRVSEKILGSTASRWEKDKVDVEKLARLIRHEGARFIDIVIGKTRTGKCYSESESFQKQVLNDIQQAKTNGTLSKLGKTAQIGLEFKHFLPIDGVFNKDFQFREAFATILSGQYGGGALTKAEVESLCPSAMQHCKKEVPLSLKSWPVRAWTRFWDTVSAIWSWFANLFGKLFGNRAKPPAKA